MTYYQHAWYSADGVHWNRGITPLDATIGVHLTSAGWDPANRRFFAADISGPMIYTSDGINWSSASAPSVVTSSAQFTQQWATDGAGTDLWFGITPGITPYPPVMEYSSDAATWALATGFAGFDSLRAVTRDEVTGRFLTAQGSGAGTHIYESASGSSWSTVTTSAPATIDCLGGFATQTLAVAQDLVNSRIYSSTDGGATWTLVYTIPGAPGFGGSQFAFNGSLYILVGTGVGDQLSSPDGITWTDGTGPGTLSVAWSPALSLWATAGGGALSDADLWTSPDGVTWMQRHVDPSATWTVPAQSIAWSPHLNLFVFVGEATYTNPPGGGGGWQLGNTTWAGATAGWGAATGQ